MIFLENGHTKEELKIINETKKILDDSKIKISATAVRIPVQNVHCESVNIEFKNNFIANKLDIIKEIEIVLIKNDMDEKSCKILGIIDSSTNNNISNLMKVII